MADRPSALVLCPESPYPAVGGGPLRSAALLEYLARRYELDVIVFRQPDGPDPSRTRIAEIVRHLHVLKLPRTGRHTTARGLRNLRRLWRGVPPLTDRFSGFAETIARLTAGQLYQVAVIEHFWCAPYAPVLQSAADRVVLDLHNIESVLHGHCTRSERWPLSALHRSFQRVCLDLERRWLPEFSSVLVPSDDDASRIASLAPGTRTAVYPNTIPLHPLPPKRENDVIVFSGNLGYHPNTNAIAFFRDHVWPQLRDRFPNLIWQLIGKNSDAIRRHVSSDPRIQVTGAVDDAVAELALAKVAVVPLRAGSGTRIKILEAWAGGTPVVSTTIGAEGLPAIHDQHLLIADSAEEFAAAVSRLYRSSELRSRIGAAGRDLYEQCFTWESGWKQLSLLGL